MWLNGQTDFPSDVSPLFLITHSQLQFKEARAQCHKAFYSCNLQVLVKARVLVPPRPFQLSLMFVCKAKSPPKWSIFQMLHYKVGSWPCSRALDKAGKVFQGQKLSLNVNNCKLRTWKRFIIFGPGANNIKLFDAYFTNFCTKLGCLLYQAGIPGTNTLAYCEHL